MSELRTDLGRAFFAEVRNDPYAHMITNMVVRAWAEGYDRATRDHDAAPVPHDDLIDRAYAWITEREQRARADMIIAMAQVGPLVHKPFGPNAGSSK